MKNLPWQKTQNSCRDGSEPSLTSFRRMLSKGAFLVPQELLKEWKDRTPAPSALFVFLGWLELGRRQRSVQAWPVLVQAKSLRETKEESSSSSPYLPCEKTSAYECASFFCCFFFSEYQRQLNLSQLHMTCQCHVLFLL